MKLNSKLKTTINLDRCAYILVVLHQNSIKAYKGICGMFNLIYAHLSLQYHDIANLVCTYLVNIPEPVLYEINTLAFPFNLRCESVT